MSKILKLIDEILSSVYTSSKKLGPGQVVLNLPKEKRDILKTLKSRDFKNLRFQDWMASHMS